MKRLCVITLILFLLNTFLFAGIFSKKSGEVVYGVKYNDKEMEGRSISLLYKDGIATIRSGRDEGKETQFLDFENRMTLNVLTFANGEKYIKKIIFDSLPQPIFTDETERVLGYECQKAEFNIRSNKIEVYYTDKTKIKGSPSLSYAANLGLVLKIVRNGNYIMFAKEIIERKVNDSEIGMDLSDAKIVNEAVYYRKTIDSRYTTVPVFKNEKINFGREIVNPEEDLIDVTYKYSKGTLILKKMPAQKFETAQMVFAEMSTWSEGDAYDRTGSMFIIPNDKKISFLEAFKKDVSLLPGYKDANGESYQGVIMTKDFDPPLELMRFFTPFGVRHFNTNVNIDGYDWADSTKYKIDISDYYQLFKKDFWIGVFIGNYVKDGHGVNLNLNFYPGYEEEVKEKWIQPLFNTLPIMEMSGQSYGTMFHNDSLTVTFTVPDDVNNLKLRYTSTGHGGWGGGDEFNPKPNEIFIDGKQVFWFVPWREDCATYRFLNPASGNFGNGVSSSDLSRSNWCPGMVTPPTLVPLKELKPGTHTMKIVIPIGEKEGSSFSHWSVSGVLIGDRE